MKSGRENGFTSAICAFCGGLLFAFTAACLGGEGHTGAASVESPRKPACSIEIPTSVPGGFDIDCSSPKLFIVTYAGEGFVTGGQLTFFPGGEVWKSIFDLNPASMRVERQGDSGVATTKGIAEGVGPYELVITWEGNRLQVDCEYEAGAGGKAGKAALDLFLDKALFMNAKRSGGNRKPDSAMGDMGRLDTLTFDTWMGKVTWTVSEECLDSHEAEGWRLRNTTVQKWRPDAFQTLSILHLTRFPSAQGLKRRLKAVAEITPRPDLGQALAAHGLVRSFDRVGARSQRIGSRVRNDADLGRLQQQLESVVTSPDMAGKNTSEVLQRAGGALSSLLTEAQPERQAQTVVIPEPREMRLQPGTFVIDGETLIVLSQDATAEDARGATVLVEELRDYFGIELEIVRSDSVPTGRRAIVIGVAGRGGAADGANLRDRLNVSSDAPGPEGYVLKVSPKEAAVVGCDSAGAFYGVQSLLQLLTKKGHGQAQIPCVDIRDWPEMKIRGMYIPLSVMSPLDYYRRTIRRVIARNKCNWLLIGPEGKLGSIRWPSHPEIAKKNAFSADELKELMAFAREHFLEIVPLVRCLGKVEGTLAVHPELAEVKGKKAFCLSNPEVREFLADIYTDALDIFQPKIFNIPCDEVAPIGVCPRCRNTPAHKLVADQVIWAHDWLKARGVRTMMVQDMLLESKTWDGLSPANSARPGVFEAVIHPAAELLPKDIIMGVWIYQKNFEETKNYAAMRHFRDMGFPVIAWTWFDKENNHDYALQAYRDKAMGFTGASYMFTSWRNINMMTVLAPEYAWTPGTPKWDALPYIPERRMQQLMSPPLPSLTVQTMEAVDLRDWCNRSLRDDVAGDGTGGWTDSGWLHDMRLLPEGRLVLEGVPYDILPFSETDGRQCVAVAGKDLKHTGLPQAVTGIRIGRKARSLSFLHTSTNTGRVRLADYVIHYADGSSETVKLIVQLNITPAEKPKIFARDWEKAMYCGYLAEARRAWVGLNLAGMETDLQAMEWVNPHPEKEIASLDMVAKCHRRGAITFLLGVTAVE